VGTLFTGAESAVAAGADVVSALNNAAVSPAFQLTVGLASLGAANVATDTVGTTAQMVMKNLPLGERSNGVIDPRGTWYHNRAFEPPRYTRTDTQLNADRAMTIIDLAAINAIHLHNSDNNGHAAGDGNGNGGGNGGGGVVNPLGGDGPGLGGDGTPEAPGGPIHQCIKWIKHKKLWFRGH
jgi:hypothetical protein